MKTDPNSLDVVNDAAPIKAPIETEENQPIIPTVEELQTPPEASIDSEAPYGRNKDGTPAKKRGRKVLTPGESGDLFARLDSVTPSTASRKPLPRDKTGASIVTDYQALGETAANLWFNVPQIFFGADWAPKPEEVPVVARGFRDYFKAQGIQELSPTLSLCLVLGAYTLERANKPTVQSKLQSMFAWIKSKSMVFKK